LHATRTTPPRQSAGSGRNISRAYCPRTRELALISASQILTQFDSHRRPTLFTFLTQPPRRSARIRSRKYFSFYLFGFHFVIPLFLQFGTFLCYCVTSFVGFSSTERKFRVWNGSGAKRGYWVFLFGGFWHCGCRLLLLFFGGWMVEFGMRKAMGVEWVVDECIYTGLMCLGND
jgi:hypothetical protein